MNMKCNLLIIKINISFKGVFVVGCKNFKHTCYILAIPLLFYISFIMFNLVEFFEEFTYKYLKVTDCSMMISVITRFSWYA